MMRQNTIDFALSVLSKYDQQSVTQFFRFVTDKKSQLSSIVERINKKHIEKIPQFVELDYGKIMKDYDERPEVLQEMRVGERRNLNSPRPAIHLPSPARCGRLAAPTLVPTITTKNCL